MAITEITEITKTGTIPTPQQDRTITLVMITSGGIAAATPIAAAAPYEFYFDPRPEELTYTHPTRASVIQTLGGAWVDDFGEGIVDISLSGHTGWRANEQTLLTANAPKDGMEKAIELRTAFFETFHKERMAAAKAGKNPDDVVKMFFVDVLNTALWQVYPVSMQLRRNKTRPLLFQYQLRLLGLEPLLTGIDQINQVSQWPTLINGIPA
jgi:hypothetical protein